MKTKSKVARPPAHTAQTIAAARQALSALDPALAVAHAVAAPFEWNVRESGFVGLIKLIIEQQVSVASAAAIWKKFEAGVGKVTAKQVATHDVETLRTFGLSRQKAQYVRAIADAELAGEIDFSHLPALADEEAIAKLVALKGVGRWTAEVYLMFCEGRTDLFPAGDLALQEGFRWAIRGKSRPSIKELYERSERWRPHRGIAAKLLWSYYRRVRAGDVPLPAPRHVTKKKPRNSLRGSSSRVRKVSAA